MSSRGVSLADVRMFHDLEIIWALSRVNQQIITSEVIIATCQLGQSAACSDIVIKTINLQRSSFLGGIFNRLLSFLLLLLCQIDGMSR